MFALNRLEWLALAAALFLCPRLSFGAEDDLFQRLDRNKDGFLSREELDTDEARRGNWLAIDRDRDGRIARSEFNAVVAQPEKPAAGAATGATAPPREKPKE